MQIQTETLKLSDGRTITVSENDWGIARRLKHLTDQARQSESVEDQKSAWIYFQRDLYPLLAAPSTGDVPDVIDAYAMPRDELDLWYLAVWRLNAEWFAKPFDEETRIETVIFRDGSKIKLVEESGMPGIVLRLLDLEDEAMLEPNDDPDIQIFRLSFYPKMAACVIEGDVPPADLLRKWPTSEINKWYEATRRVNPEWFLQLDAISDEAQRAATEREKEQKKKAGTNEAG